MAVFFPMSLSQPTYMTRRRSNPFFDFPIELCKRPRYNYLSSDLFRALDLFNEEAFAPRPMRFRPFINNKNNNNDFKTSLSVQGFEPEDVKIKVDERHNRLTISAKKEESDESGTKVFRQMHQMVTLPRGCDVSKIQARVNDGQLQIEAPNNNTRAVENKTEENKEVVKVDEKEKEVSVEKSDPKPFKVELNVGDFAVDDITIEVLDTNKVHVFSEQDKSFDHVLDFDLELYDQDTLKSNVYGSKLILEADLKEKKVVEKVNVVRKIPVVVRED